MGSAGSAAPEGGGGARRWRRARSWLLAAGVALVGGLMLPASAFATTYTETWVSATGSDASTTCSITAPCATFAHALTETSAGGEIDVLSSGSYGAITISEPVTIYASGVNAVIDFTGV